MARQIVVRALVPAVRPDLLGALLRSWVAHPRNTAGIEIHVVAQREPKDAFADAIESAPGLPLTWEYLPNGEPPYPLRMRTMRTMPEVDVWVNLDDDMELLPETDWWPAIERAQDPGVGVVSCAWARSEAPAVVARVWPAKGPLWVRQPVVNRSGGSVWSREVVEALCVDIRPWQFCDIQESLSAYVAGYENWRYRGSLLIHRVLAAGGLKTVFATQAMESPDPALITTRPCRPIYTGAGSGNNWLMPVNSDLTKEAHRRHRAARAWKGWS